MAVKAKLKFRGDMPWELELKLINKYGFRVATREHKQWVIVEKIKSNFKPEVLVNGELEEEVTNNLIKRCNVIMGHFKDPIAQAYMIRVRLNNVAATLPPQQRKFVHEWIERNVEKVD